MKALYLGILILVAIWIFGVTSYFIIKNLIFFVEKIKKDKKSN